MEVAKQFEKLKESLEGLFKALKYVESKFEALFSDVFRVSADTREPAIQMQMLATETRDTMKTYLEQLKKLATAVEDANKTSSKFEVLEFALRTAVFQTNVSQDTVKILKDSVGKRESLDILESLANTIPSSGDSKVEANAARKALKDATDKTQSCLLMQVLTTLISEPLVNRLLQESNMALDDMRVDPTTFKSKIRGVRQSLDATWDVYDQNISALGEIIPLLEKVKIESQDEIVLLQHTSAIKAPARDLGKVCDGLLEKLKRCAEKRKLGMPPDRKSSSLR